jgi:hypothetical protein
VPAQKKDSSSGAGDPSVAVSARSAEISQGLPTVAPAGSVARGSAHTETGA